MAEQYPSDVTLNALSGSSESEQEVLYLPIAESPYYTSFYKMLYRLLDVARRAGDLRVYKDGANTFGVRAGELIVGDTPVSFPATAGESLTNDATNYIYLTAGGVLTKNTTGFPDPSVTPHLPLATIDVGSASQAQVDDEYDFVDITDFRGRAMMRVLSAATPSELNTLTDGSNADNLHVHSIGTSWLEDDAVTGAKLNDAQAENLVLVEVEDLAAGGDISARPVFVSPRGAMLISAGILTKGAPAGVDDSNTAVIALKDDAANTIVSKTYNTGTQPPTNDYADLGTLSETHKTLAATEHVTLTVTCGTTADLPAFSIVLRYVVEDA